MKAKARDLLSETERVVESADDGGIDEVIEGSDGDSQEVVVLDSGQKRIYELMDNPGTHVF